MKIVILKQYSSIKYPIHIKCGDKDISTSEDNANELNKFFTNISSNFAKNITNSDGNFSICDYLGGRIRNCLYLKPADEEEVINVVKACTRNKYTGFEDLNMNSVANIIPVISKRLTHICNNSFKTGVFPSRMKISKIKPIFRSGTKTDIGNYRHISLLSQFKKKLEKVFLYRLDHFFNAKDILNSSQYGFRKAMSTSHAVMELIEEISKATDNKKHAIGVFIDS